jgi:hypothetical protein
MGRTIVFCGIFFLAWWKARFYRAVRDFHMGFAWFFVVNLWLLGGHSVVLMAEMLSTKNLHFLKKYF